MDGMTHHQHPLGSGFSAASTAADVLKGIDLTDRNVIITGGFSGIGRETTRALGDAGASVLVGVRNPDRAATALSGAIGTAGVELDRLDLLDPAFAARYRESGRPLHILINNAGIVSPTLGRDPRGYELPVRHQPPRSPPADAGVAASAARRGWGSRGHIVLLGSPLLRHRL
jgi:NAD(P)-dependent dehydrogenase (short-subunit alcohol dehydrogenase family)